MALNPVIESVTAEITRRSVATRSAYLDRCAQYVRRSPVRKGLGCTNFAHGFAACPEADKDRVRDGAAANIAIVSAYNDMLSAHQPLADYPALIKEAARAVNCTAQFAGGVPAMCDGVTQGEPGMELSLFSRDVIAMSTAIALSHSMFDAVLCLGVCDKIVPGLLIGALAFGHMPCIFVPAGPMTSGLANDEKSRIRQLFAEGKVGRDALLEAETRAYHGPGTCTFYGTANSNQMLMEVMGLHLPGAAFINPGTPLRDALTRAAAARIAGLTALGDDYIPLSSVIDEKAIVNGIVGLLATGGSTNHTIHLVAIARAAGIVINWDDFDKLSSVIPLLARVYPNGKADVNQFHAAGGMSFMMRELIDAGLLHEDVTTVMGQGLRAYCSEPWLAPEGLQWRDGVAQSGDDTILRTASAPFSAEGGLRLLKGNLGRAVIKVSAVKPEHRVVRAPAVCFDSQEAMQAAFAAGTLARDCVVVVRYQGPRANGMPELHKLTPPLGVLQDRGFHVALVTDGRMSGASGKVPAAIHVTPECINGGMLARVRDGDMITLDANRGVLEAEVVADEWNARQPAPADTTPHGFGMGRELFASLRANALGAEQGALTCGTLATAQHPTMEPAAARSSAAVIGREAEA
ncbi:MAG: phosphogluconate dehydratase [Gammaproteobacteria bacterium]|nr:phosphogluconate dehydratase [Gammaproteobacteria bacterium]